MLVFWFEFFVFVFYHTEMDISKNWNIYYHHYNDNDVDNDDSNFNLKKWSASTMLVLTMLITKIIVNIIVFCHNLHLWNLSFIFHLLRGRYHREGAESWTRRAHTYNKTCSYSAMRAPSSSSSTSSSSYLSSLSPTISPSIFTSSSSSASASSSTSWPSMVSSSLKEPSLSSLSSEESSSATASSSLFSTSLPSFKNSTYLSSISSVNQTNANKMNIKKHLNNNIHLNISTLHHTGGMNWSKRLKCETSHCIQHSTPHTPHSAHTTHARHGSDNRQKSSVGTSNLNSNSNKIAITPISAAVLTDNSYVTRAAVVNYCK